MRKLPFIVIISAILISGFILFWSEPAKATHSCTDYSAVTNTRALYHLEDETDSDNGFDLTNNNSVTFVAAYFTNGADMEASSSMYLSTTALGTAQGIGANNSSTFVLTFKPESQPGGSNQDLLVHYDDGPDIAYYIRYINNGGTRTLRFSRDRRGVASVDLDYVVTLATSEFRNIILTWDTAVLSGYLSGIGVVATGTATGNGSFADTTELDIGVNTDGNSFADGIIDEVIVETGTWSSSTVDNYWANNFNNCPADAVAGPSTHLLRGHGRTRNNTGR